MKASFLQIDSPSCDQTASRRAARSRNLWKHQLCRSCAAFHALSRLFRLGLHESCQTSPTGFDMYQHSMDAPDEPTCCLHYQPGLFYLRMTANIFKIYFQIVLGEESDDFDTGKVTNAISHYELYLKAMIEVGTVTVFETKFFIKFS